MFWVQSIFACLKFCAFCKKDFCRKRSLLVAKENQKTTSDFNALDP